MKKCIAYIEINNVDAFQNDDYLPQFDIFFNKDINTTFSNFSAAFVYSASELTSDIYTVNSDYTNIN